MFAESYGSGGFELLQFDKISPWFALFVELSCVHRSGKAPFNFPEANHPLHAWPPSDLLGLPLNIFQLRPRYLKRHRSVLAHSRELLIRMRHLQQDPIRKRLCNKNPPESRADLLRAWALLSSCRALALAADLKSGDNRERCETCRAPSVHSLTFRRRRGCTAAGSFGPQIRLTTRSHDSSLNGFLQTSG
jgi:hypothetical protein